jgi:hypothetical protein
MAAAFMSTADGDPWTVPLCRQYTASDEGGIVRKERKGQRAARRLWLVTLVTGLAAGWFLAGASARPAAAAIATSDRTYKADLLGRLGYAPRLVFVGGSRSLRFSPTYAYRRTGLRGFNAAVVECMNEDVWALMHLMVKRAPKVKRYVVWGIVPGTMFLTRQFDSALVRDRRLRSWFPLSLRQAQGSGIRHPVGRRRYARDGGLTWDRFAAEAAAGVTLAEKLQPYIERARRNPFTLDAISTKMTRGRRYFEDALAYLNARDCEPLLILTPVHPKVLRVMRNDHWDSWHASLLAYFTELQTRYHFTVLDFTFISSFNGDPAAFYDVSHMKASNMRRMLAAAVREAPWAFGKGDAPWDEPDPTPSPTPSPTPAPQPAGSASPLAGGEGPSPGEPQ